MVKSRFPEMLRAANVRRWVFAVPTCALLMCAAAFIARRAAADVQLRQSGALAGIEQACELDPGRAACWARLAEARETLGLDATEAWRKSIAANPRDASVLTQAAMSAEARGDFRSAETLLLEAEGYNHLWLPRWTLTNFYYRRNRAKEFWLWMRAAFERPYGDPSAVFRLCANTGADPAWLLENILPAAPEILKAFVYFLIRENRLEPLPASALKYAAKAVPAEQGSVTAALTSAADALISANRFEAALRLWNELARRNYIPYPAWSAEAPLMNGAFQTPLATPAFDWRAPQPEGVTAIFGAPLDGVKIGLSGQQAVDAELLTQFVVLAPGRRYRFAFDYQTREIDGDGDGNALRWTVVDIHSGEPYGMDCPALSSAFWEHVRLSFETPPGTRARLARLSLSAGAMQGNARMRGEIWFRRVRMEAY